MRSLRWVRQSAARVRKATEVHERGLTTGREFAYGLRFEALLMTQTLERLARKQNG